MGFERKVAGNLLEDNDTIMLLVAEWNGKTIPFAKGCSFYICSADGEAPLIRYHILHFHIILCFLVSIHVRQALGTIMLW